MEAAQRDLKLDYIEENDRMYSWLLRKIEKRHSKIKRRKDVEKVLELVGKAAAFAAAHHTGRFADGALENVLLDIAARWCRVSCEAKRKRLDCEPRRILHVASQLNYIGGHARMVSRWIECDENSCHSILVTAAEMPLANALVAAAVKSGGQVYELKTKVPILERCGRLRALAQQADLVVLHHDGHDVIPTVAFASEGLPVVVILNHADHQFWLGSSVCDLLINLRSCAEKDIGRRQIRDAVVLPITLGNQASIRARSKAISAPGHKEDDIILLSIARGVKFKPAGGFNFIATAGKILDKNSSAHLYIVGETRQGLLQVLQSPPHERIHFAGEVEDPTCFRDVADIYLETFPFGSQTALLESALAGLPVVRAFAPLSPLLVADDDAINELVPASGDEEAYIEEVTRLCSDLQARRSLGEVLQRQVMDLHTGQSWLQNLMRLYVLTDKLHHRPRALQPSTSARGADDIALGHWQAAEGGRLGRASSSIWLTRARHRVRIARFVGNARFARQNAWIGVVVAPFDWLSWRLLGGAILGHPRRNLSKYINKVTSYVSR